MSELRGGAVLRRGFAAPFRQARDAQCAQGPQGAARGRGGQARRAGAARGAIIRRAGPFGGPGGLKRNGHRLN